ncbi:hypothetical protein IAT38_002830 [Cryptococcus sp. DSM 104549]
MSSSPTKYYYASRPSSRSGSGSRPTSPPSSAQVRSQAIAKLKRAASLPRGADGRRPSQRHARASGEEEEGAPMADDSFEAPQPSLEDAVQPPYTPGALAEGVQDAGDDDRRDDEQEMLSPSPVATAFDHSNIYPSVHPIHMQRSASAASSYNHMVHTNGAYYGQPSPTTGVAPDWHAIQLAQSYLPSLTPPSLGQNAYPQSVPIAGRNTPSPLPTLGELRTLQRSNSQAARAKAMSKLTGGRDTPSDDDIAVHPSPSRAGGLQRAGTLGALGANRMMRLPVPRMDAPGDREEVAAPPPQDEDQPIAFAEPRPRLQRSFTVSSSNMGEERRSAVGRRMVERLAERRQQREQEEEEVKRLWQERRAAAEAAEQHPAPQDLAGELAVPEQQQQEEYTDGEAPRDAVDPLPILARTSPVAPAYEPESAYPADMPSYGAAEMLAAPDRPASRGTMRSVQFEYEDHLRRSLSSRTARGAMGTNTEPVPAIVMSEDGHDDPRESLQPSPLPEIAEPIGEDDESGDAVEEHHSPLLPPHPHFATPTRHAPHSSTSTQSTVQGTQSPGGSSTLSGLDSMMFVMGGTGTPPGQSGAAGERVKGREQHWPSEVDGGSDWGTPARDLHQATFTDSPTLQSPATFEGQGRGSISESMAARGSGGSGSGHLSPPSRNSTRTDSVMSWEEVGGKEDQEARVPTDNTYHSRSGSVSAKIRRTVKTAIRKRSQSRSSVTSSSPPTSPRRGSATSVTPSTATFSGGRAARHQPSISSLSPSVVSGQGESSTSNLLIQHQLSSDPSQVSLLPRANLNDPRIHMSKLSPFPGIESLERGQLGEPPRLVHQVSDSVVPSQQSTSSGSTRPDSIYTLPLPPRPSEPRRLSDDSISKRNWLAKALTSPRSSMSRKVSNPDFHGHRGRDNTLGQGAQIISSDVDPFAPPPNGATITTSARPRPSSPTVSVVPEVSEEGSRFTRFTVGQGDVGEAGPPAIVEEEEVLQAESGQRGVGAGAEGWGARGEKKPEPLTEKSVEVLRRMDKVLAMGPDDPARPEILDDPPRKFLLSAQILQVVNVHTVKDRFLFLFNDILVISKPIITHGVHATLDMKFVVKSIVSLDKLVVSGFSKEPDTEPERHPVVSNFIHRFAENPKEACKYLVERSNPKVDSVTLASLIFKTPELDKAQIGAILAGNEVLMRAFVERFHFVGVRIDEALRLFLLSLRLPTEPTSCETLLRGFAHSYHEANVKRVTYDRELAADLVLAIIQFNDMLYSTFGFALPNHAITRETFISAFRSKDPQGLVPDELLRDVYTSIRGQRLVQALSAVEAPLAREVVVTPARIPPKLTYNVWSERIYVSIPTADPLFKIKLHGEGLEFDPPMLDFTTSAEESFRVRGTSLGTKSLLFERQGSNAALYGSLGNTRHFTVERAFMRHTFQIAFVSHTGLKRKYCFSVNNAEARHKWGTMLKKQIQETKAAKSVPVVSQRQRIRQTAEAVSIQVLRDALIPPEQKPEASHALQATGSNMGSTTRPITPLRPGTSGSISAAGLRPGTAGAPEAARQRTGSVSIAYAQHALKEEYDLGPLQPTRAGNPSEAASGMVDLQTGKELVLLCKQNSLMPGLLELLQSGIEGGDVDQGGHGGEAWGESGANGYGGYGAYTASPNLAQDKMSRMESFRAKGTRV